MQIFLRTAIGRIQRTGLQYQQRCIACLAALTEQHQIFRRTCREVVRAEIAPKAAAHDEKGDFPAAQIERLGELGLMAVTVQKDYGGAGLDYLSYAIAMEELARGDAACSVIMGVNNLYASTVQLHGNHEQCVEFLTPYTNGKNIAFYALSEPGNGSDASAVSTSATIEKDQLSYRINGTKAWISNSKEAKGGVVFASTDKTLKHKGITAFLTEKNIAGLVVAKSEHKMGMRASSTCQVVFEDVIVPCKNVLKEPGVGFKIAMQSLDCGRIGIGAQAVGIAQACLELAVDFAHKHGTPTVSRLSKLQVIQEKVANMALGIETARLLTWRAAWLKDNGYAITKEAAMAKLKASEAATFCAHQCMQILGGLGYMSDSPAQLHFRNARVTEIYEGTSEIQRLVIANAILKEMVM